MANCHRANVISPLIGGIMLGFGLSAPAWLALFDYVHGSNRGAQSAIAHWQWLVPVAALPGFILPSWTVNWVDFSSRYLSHGATELACGFVPPVVLIGGLLVLGRRLVRRIGWELALLIILVTLSMLPSAGVFRWSFRWLPFIHLTLALCAAETLRFMGAERRTGRALLIGLALFLVTCLAAFFFKTGGPHFVPVATTLLALLLAWVGVEFIGPPLLREWAPALTTFAVLLCTYLIIPPNCGVPKYNLSQNLLNLAPLDPHRLYLSVYPPAEVVYRREQNPEPVGQIVRPGSTSMFAGLKFINGYSPILAGGVAKEFGFAIHGEFDWAMQKKLLETSEGDQLLGELGVNGIVVSSESGMAPRPVDEWEMVFESEEGKVYHRRDLTRDPAALSKVETRTSLACTVRNGDEGKLFVFSRPFFPGYRAKLNGREISVTSWRGLVPAVELPRGAESRLVLTYRPGWLIWGGVSSLVSAVILIACAFLAWRRRSADVVEAVVPTA